MKNGGSIFKSLALALVLAGAGHWCALSLPAQSVAFAQEMRPPRDGQPGPGAGPRGRRPGMRRQDRQEMMQFRILDRLSRMSPEDRERLLAKLPPPRRRSVESNLRRFQQMPPARRAALAERLRQFEQMTPERQSHLRELLRTVGQMPPERRRELQGEFARIKRMSDEDRLDYTSSAAFQEKFNESERDLLLDLVETAPAP